MGKYSLTQLAIFAVIILGIIAIVYVAATAMGVPIPMWVLHILGIIFVVFVAVLAIKFVADIGSGPPPAP